MTYAWLPGAERVQTPADGGCMKGGAPRAVWLVLYADPMLVSARSAAVSLIKIGRPGHLVWNPSTGDMAQLIPVVRGARALGWGHRSGQPRAARTAGRQSWGAEPYVAPGADVGPAVPSAPDGLAAVNTEGRICAQIVVIGRSWIPFTDGPLARADEIVSWLDSWRIPRSWPAGPPASFPFAVAVRNIRRDWARGGHFGASQVPGNARPDPGAIDIELLTGPAGQQAQPGGVAASPASLSRPGSPARIPAMIPQPRLTMARSAAP